MLKKLWVPGLLLLAILLTIKTIYEDRALAVKAQDLSQYDFYRFDTMRQLQAVPLKDLKGETVDLSTGNGQWQLINLGYMFCPDICPVNLAFMSELKQEWDEIHQQDLLSITHITFDPERDKPENLSEYLNYIDENLYGLTGELENIRKVATQLNTVFIHEQPDQYGNYFITHSDSIALLNPQGNYVGLFKGPYDKDNVIKALDAIVN